MPWLGCTYRRGRLEGIRIGSTRKSTQSGDRRGSGRNRLELDEQKIECRATDTIKAYAYEL